jgi:aminopeptidase N
MGHELFDYAFQKYSKRWMFKHPTPEDFFRTMEDASAVDLDWFWRGWFYTTDYSDIGVKEVKSYRLTNKPTQKMLDLLKKYNVDILNVPPMVYLSNEPVTEGEPESIGDIKELESFVKDAEVDTPAYYYEVTFNKPGGLVLPIIAEYSYEDGTKERKVYPAQIWRKNDKEVSKLITSSKKLVSIQVDPDLETADIDTSNNSWPKKEEKSKFDTFKEKQ